MLRQVLNLLASLQQLLENQLKYYIFWREIQGRGHFVRRRFPAQLMIKNFKRQPSEAPALGEIDAAGGIVVIQFAEGRVSNLKTRTVSKNTQRHEALRILTKLPKTKKPKETLFVETNSAYSPIPELLQFKYFNTIFKLNWGGRRSRNQHGSFFVQRDSESMHVKQQKI